MWEKAGLNQQSTATTALHRRKRAFLRVLLVRSGKGSRANSIYGMGYKQMKIVRPGKSNGKDIRSQIMSGYIKVIAMIALLAAIMFLSFYWIQRSYTSVMHYENNRSDIQSAIAGHYKWLDQLNTSILTSAEFSGSLDHNSCSFGQWKSGLLEQDLNDIQIQSAVEAASGPHEAIHTAAQEILTLSKTNQTAAFQRYESEIKPQTNEVIQQLEIIDGHYAQAADKSSASLKFFLTFAILCTLLLTLAVIAISMIYAKRLSSKISRPIVAVSEWAKKLALGIEDLEFDATLLNENQDNEVGAMTVLLKQWRKAFRKM